MSQTRSLLVLALVPIAVALACASSQPAQREAAPAAASPVDAGPPAETTTVATPEPAPEGPLLKARDGCPYKVFNSGAGCVIYADFSGAPPAEVPEGQPIPGATQRVIDHCGSLRFCGTAVTCPCD